MREFRDSTLFSLLSMVVGSLRAQRLLETMDNDAALLSVDATHAPRGVIAQALAIMLVDEVSRRIPAPALAYLREQGARGLVRLDHTAVRTLEGPCGELPFGQTAFTRIIEPLGFERAAPTPTPRMRSTANNFRHADFPEAVTMFVIGEMHMDRFSPECQAAIQNVVSRTRDPLPESAKRSLEQLKSERRLPIEQAARLLPNLFGCWDRQHDHPKLADYEVIFAESKELAWFTTEGQLTNHTTLRVPDVTAFAEEQKRLGRPMKETIEISPSGRILQTAFRPATIERLFYDASGTLVPKMVPGPFLEIVTRHEESPGKLDLNFDIKSAGNLLFSATSTAEK